MTTSDKTSQSSLSCGFVEGRLIEIIVLLYELAAFISKKLESQSSLSCGFIEGRLIEIIVLLYGLAAFISKKLESPGFSSRETQLLNKGSKLCHLMNTSLPSLSNTSSMAHLLCYSAFIAFFLL